MTVLHGGKKPCISREAIDLLMEHSWPGNVRELQNVIQFAVMKSKNKEILPEHLPPYLIEKRITPSYKMERRKKLTQAQVIEALQKAKGNKRQAAKALGVARSTLYRFLDSLNN